MTSAAILVVDIIGSKELASQPGGHSAILDLCDGMRAFLDTTLKQFNYERALTITPQTPQGDDIEYRLEAASLETIADISLAAAISAFLSSH